MATKPDAAGWIVAAIEEGAFEDMKAKGRWDLLDHVRERDPGFPQPNRRDRGPYSAVLCR
jgi:hypothetical protein